MPLEFGFLEQPANLSDIDFLRLDAEQIVEDTLSFFQTNYPGVITDYNKSQTAMMLLHAQAKMVERLSYRTEALVKNNLLSTTRHRPTGAKILSALGYDMGRPLAALGDGRATLNEAINDVFYIEAGTQIEVSALDGNPLYYEFFSKENDQIDFEAAIEFPAGQTEITNLVCIEGQTYEEEFDNDSELEYPAFELDEENILNDYFKVTVNGLEWERVDRLIYQSVPGRYYEIRHQTNGKSVLRFGNGIFGAKPQQGDEIYVKYRVGGGTRGLVVADYFNIGIPIFVGGTTQQTISVVFSNASATQGGADEEALNHARIYGPKNFAALGKGGTGEDYTTIANLHTSSLGSVMKAVAVHRGRASASGTIDGPFVIDNTNKNLRILTTSGATNVSLTEGTRTAQEVADDITSQGTNSDFAGAIYGDKVIIYTLQDDNTDVVLDIEEIANNAYSTLGIGIGRYAQWGSRHVDIYAFARGPADSNNIPTAVVLSQAQKDELVAKLSASDRKMLTDEVEIKDALYKTVDITATIQVNKGVDIDNVQAKVEEATNNFFNPENWEFGQRLNTVDIEKMIYNSVSGIADTILSAPQTAIESTGIELISKGTIDYTFEYVG